MTGSSPWIMCLTLDANEHLVQMPAPAGPVAPAYPGLLSTPANTGSNRFPQYLAVS